MNITLINRISELTKLFSARKEQKKTSNLLKRSLVAISALVGMAAIPAVSFASPARPGPYMSVFLGASALQDTTATISEFNPVTTKNAQVEFDPGLNIGATAGYDFGFLRLEGEMSYKQSEINSVSEQTFGTRYVNVDGHLGAFAMMMNGFFDLHNESPVTPYLGCGIGFASLNLNNTRGVDANSGALNDHIFRSDDDFVFAYQAGAGLEFALNQRLSLDLGYRYFGTSRGSFRKEWPNSTDLKFESHNAAVGLRLKF
ncbi:MAG TPA: outer membrane beta-barrel protein [Desulfuromonadaceae bacterium]